jgi:CheY-like chemotaxis protein
MSAGEVFIVDDNPDNLGLLSGILREAGYGVRLANSGRRALQAIALSPPELVLLDVNMPELSGLQVCEQLKQDAATRDLPVIFLSALDDVRDKLAAFRAGAVDYVTKPFQAEEVLARVGSQLQLSRLRRELLLRNQELSRKNDELQRAFQSADAIFAALSDALAGTVLDGRYRLEQRIGAGGFSAVFRARHLGSGRPVAVKVLRPAPGGDADRQRQRFLREGVSAARAGHENAVTVYEAAVTSSGIAYLVMELLEGGTFAEELAVHAPLPFSRCAQVLAPVCRALAEAHAQGLVHRDVKPANIFLHRAAEGEVVKLVDFGIAKATSDIDPATQTGRFVGTPAYTSPERLLGDPYDGRADVYAVGVTLYQALTGRFPIDVPQGPLGAVVLALVSGAPAPLGQSAPGAPREVEALVMRTLAKDPQARPSAAELAEALLALSATTMPPLRDARGNPLPPTVDS